MQDLYSNCVRGPRRSQNTPDPRPRYIPTASPEICRSSGASATMTPFGAGLINLLVLLALSFGGYWLCSQKWSFSGAADAADADSELPWNGSCLVDLSWSADGRVLLSRTVGQPQEDCPLRLHRFSETGAASIVSCQSAFANEEPVWRALLTPDAAAVVVVGESKRISRIEIASGIRTKLLDVSGQERIPAIAIASDGATLAVALEGEIRLCDPRSGQERRRLSSRASSVTSLVFSEDNRHLAAGYGDGVIRTWNTDTGNVDCELGRHAGPVAAVRFVTGRQCLASVGVEGDDTLRLWDLELGELLWQMAAGQSGLHALALSNEGRLAATGGIDGDIVLWSLSRRVRLRALSGHTATVEALQFSPDDTSLTSVSNDGTIRIWNVATSELFDALSVGTNSGESSENL